MSQNNILGVVVFAVFLGIAIVVSGERSQTILKVINELFENYHVNRALDHAPGSFWHHGPFSKTHRPGKHLIALCPE